jgi:hypothetical protein
VRAALNGAGDGNRRNDPVDGVGDRRWPNGMGV